MKFYELELLYKENYASCEDIVSLLQLCVDVKEYFIILHDKDVDINNNLKKAHYHCYIGFEDYGRKTYDICKSSLCFCSSIVPIKSIKSALCYGLHLGYDNKYQYKLEDYVTNNVDRLKNSIDSFTPSTEYILNNFVELVMKGLILNDYQVLCYFKEKKMLKYYTSHYSYILKLKNDIACSIIDFSTSERSDINC